jgi:hypothetical protein
MPPDELVRQWRNSKILLKDALMVAAQWGADQELEACCEWVSQWRCMVGGNRPEVGLRAARRPKPPSLKEQALGALSRADKDALTNPLTGEVVALRTILNKEQSDTIRRALEALPE